MDRSRVPPTTINNIQIACNAHKDNGTAEVVSVVALGDVHEMSIFQIPCTSVSN